MMHPLFEDATLGIGLLLVVGFTLLFRLFFSSNVSAFIAFQLTSATALAWIFLAPSEEVDPGSGDIVLRGLRFWVVILADLAFSVLLGLFILIRRVLRLLIDKQKAKARNA